MTSLEGARLVDDDNINRVLVFYFLKIYKSAVNLPLCSVFSLPCSIFVAFSP